MSRAIPGLRAIGVALALVIACLVLLPAPAEAIDFNLPRQPQGPVGGDTLARPGTVAGTAAGVPALPAGISAQGFVVADLGTGDVLAARNAHGRYLPASTLKTLTAVALLPELDLDSVHPARFEDVNIEGSKVGLVPGERYSVRSLLHAMLVVSGNDAANALATAAGGRARAIALLNATAQRLQALDTYAANPSGLDAPGQLTSAYDLALITREGMRNAHYRKAVGTLRSWINAPGGRRFEIYNHNKMLTRYAGANGGKTGYTVKARHCFVVTAKRGNRELVVTLLKAETRYEDAVRLLDWGFAAAGRVKATGELVEPLAAAPAGRARVEQADRSRTAMLAPPSPAAVALQPAPTTSRRTPLPFSPSVAGAALGTAAIAGVGVRRRQVRRRRYGRSHLVLRLPVR